MKIVRILKSIQNFEFWRIIKISFQIVVVLAGLCAVAYAGGGHYAVDYGFHAGGHGGKDIRFLIKWYPSNEMFSILFYVKGHGGYGE